jgi:hypothetical protein
MHHGHGLGVMIYSVALLPQLALLMTALLPDVPHSGAVRLPCTFNAWFPCDVAATCVHPAC